ncbi:MAG: phosphatase PAP2 family protein, partial [Lactobacillus iners]|nr:phosphatase PAP2 family protein [Lactobacillus iners]
DSICHRKGYSFPSGHVLSAMTLIYLLIFTFNLEKNIILVCIFITILLGIISSRIFLRQHHLLDVIASLVLSRICFLIAIFIWRIL